MLSPATSACARPSSTRSRGSRATTLHVAGTTTSRSCEPTSPPSRRPTDAPRPADRRLGRDRRPTGAARHRLDGRDRRVRGPDGRQRLGQDHPGPRPDRPAAPRVRRAAPVRDALRRVRRVVADRLRPSASGCVLGCPDVGVGGGRVRPPHAASPAAPAVARRPCGDRPRARGGRPAGPTPREGHLPVRRAAAAGADRPCARRRARPVRARRADGRGRPAEPAGAGRRAGAPQGRRRHRRARGPRARPPRPTRRPGGGDARRPDHLRRTAARRPRGAPPVVRRPAHPPPPHRRDAGGSARPRPAPRPARGPPMSTIGFWELLSLDFMQRALLAAAFTGLAAPAVGTYLVQRRLSLMGDGIGHVAVTGVALGLITGLSPTWTAIVVCAVGAVLIEIIRERGHANGDVALALMFYGGLAGGVLLTGLAGQSGAYLQRYLFGSITTLSLSDLWATMILAAVVVVVCVGLSPQLFAVAQDQEFARVAGLNVRAYNIMVAVLAAGIV